MLGETTVTVGELGDRTARLFFFSYVGTDADFHHFTTADGGRYRVRRSEWQNAGGFAVGGGMALYVCVKDGKVTVPDPKDMAAWVRAGRPRPPLRACLG